MLRDPIVWSTIIIISTYFFTLWVIIAHKNLKIIRFLITTCCLLCLHCFSLQSNSFFTNIASINIKKCVFIVGLDTQAQSEENQSKVKYWWIFLLFRIWEKDSLNSSWGFGFGKILGIKEDFEFNLGLKRFLLRNFLISFSSKEDSFILFRKPWRRAQIALEILMF